MEPAIRVLSRLARLLVAAAALAAALTLGGATAATAAPSPGPGDVTVSLPPGVTLPPGTYHGTVKQGGKQVPVTVVVAPGAPAPGTTTGPAASTPAGGPAGGGSGSGSGGGSGSGSGGGSGGIGLPVLIGLLLALLAGGGTALYLKVLVPRRHVVAYRRALEQVRAGRYDEALPVLTRTETVLPPRLRTDARFFIAFALYRIRDLAAAEHRLAALHRENPHNPDVGYLLAYLRAGRGDFDGAERVLDVMADAGLLEVGQLRRLYGMVLAERGFRAIREGRIDAAAELFEKVERLGDFAAQVPVDLRNRNVLLGTKALFARDVDTAREQFSALDRAGDRLPADQRDALLAAGKLGLALAGWLSEAPDAVTTADRLLAEALRLLDPDEALEQPWPDGTADADLADRLAAMVDRASRPPEEIDRDRTLRDVHFLRGMVVLREWAEADGPAARDAADDYLDRALRRFARARELDPEFSDVYLVVGLLRYYLSDEDGRRAGVAALREAQKLGTRDPRVLQIINHHDRLSRANRDAADAYLQILDQYLRDGTVRDQVRSALIARMGRYGRMRDWDSRPELVRVRTGAPTVAELHQRSELLLERVRQLLANQSGNADLSGAGDLTRRLEHESRTLADYARAVEEQEAELLTMLGDRLLADLEV